MHLVINQYVNVNVNAYNEELDRSFGVPPHANACIVLKLSHLSELSSVTSAMNCLIITNGSEPPPRPLVLYPPFPLCFNTLLTSCEPMLLSYIYFLIIASDCPATKHKLPTQS